MRRIRLALVGLGGVAQAHLAAYSALPEIEIVAGVDPNPQRRVWAEERFGIATHAELETALAAGSIDLACVLTPASLHREHSVCLLERGIHVLCEKPLAVGLEDALAMNEAAGRCQRRLFYGATYRFMPALRQAREMVMRGAIGAPKLLMEQMIGGRGARERIPPLSAIHYPVGGPGGGGMGLVDHGVHLLDIFSWILDEKAEWVFGQGEISGGGPTVESVHIGYASGARGSLIYFDSTFSARLPNEGAFCGGAEWGIDSTYYAPGQWNNAPGEILIYGEEGALRVRHYGNQIFHFHKDGVAMLAVDGAPPPAHFGQQMRAVLSDIDSPGGALATNADVGIESLRMLLAVYESARTGKAVCPADIRAAK